MATRIYLLHRLRLAVVFLITSHLGGAAGIGLSLGFITQPSDVTAERNRPLILNCSAFSGTEYGPVKITWRHKGVDVTSNDSRRTVLTNGSLYFTKVKRTGESDAGDYQCIAKNTVGSLVSRKASLTIANISRKFTLEPQTQSVKEGDVVRLSCQIAAIPPPVFAWQKNKKNLPQDDRWVVLENSGVLLINGVLMTDTGKYRCIATSAGIHRRSEEASLEIEEAIAIYRPPQILTPHHMVKVRTGEEAILECAASGYPKPQISWLKMDMLDPKRGTQVGQGNLVFTKVMPNDRGVYTCNATNVDPDTKKVRSVTQTVDLQVLVPPDFLKRPHSLTGSPAQTVRMECDVSGYPTPTVYWLKNGSPLRANGRIKLKNNSNYELVILQTVTGDAGIYQCVAENEAGYGTADARLHINTSSDQPDPPTGLRAETLSSTSVRLSWNVSTTRNGLPIQAYTVHCAPAIRNEVERQEVSQNSSFAIEGLKPFTNYSCYVRAYNGKSASDQSETIICSTGEDIPLEAPSVTLSSSSPTNLLVAWDELSSELSRGVIVTYKIQWRHYNSPSHYIQEIPGDIREYTITGLTPGATYEVRVMGATKVSYPILADSDWPWVRHEMPGQVTAKVPLPPILDLTVVNATTIKVQWKIPENNEYEICGYKLTYRKQKHKLQGPIVLSDNSTFQYMLTDLISHTWYEVHVIAYNNNGDGREAVRVILTLGHQLPDDSKPNIVLVEPPSHLEAMPTSSTSISITWRDPLTTKNISYFTVRYNPVHAATDVNASTVQYIRSTSKDVVVTDLTPFTLYEFSVRSHDQDNKQGPYSSKVECQTKEDVPTEPQDLNWMPLTAQSIRLTWKPPKHPNGIITSYHVMYNTDRDPHVHPEKWTIKEEDGSELSTKINGLASNTAYYFCLRAKTNAGTGPPTDPITLNIPYRNQSTPSPPDYNHDFQDPQLGIIVGVSIGVGCMIVCAVIILFRNRCFPAALEPPHHYIHHYHHHHRNGHLPNSQCNGRSRTDHRLSSSDSHEMESFMPMLTDTISSHIDTKGVYPLHCCNGNGNGLSNKLHNPSVVNGHAVRDKQTINITENPQHTTWYTSSDHRYLNERGGNFAPPSPLLVHHIDRDEGVEEVSDPSQNEDSGVQLAPSQGSGSCTHDSCSFRGSEESEQSSATAVAAPGHIVPLNGSLPRSRSWDTPIQHAEALHAHLPT